MQQGIFQFLAPIRRRWWLVAIVVIPICLIVAGVSIFSPTRYDGFVTITEKRIDPESEVKVYPYLGTNLVDVQTRMNNLIRTIASETVLEKTFRDLLDANEWTPKSRDLMGGFLEFRENINVEPLRGSEHIRIHFYAASPDEALNGIKRLYANFRDVYVDLNSGKVRGEKEFIKTQLDESRAEFARINERLTKFKEENDAVGLSAETSNLVGLRADVLQKTNEAERDLLSFRRALSSWQEVVDREGAKPMLVSQDTTALNPIYNQLLSDLAQTQTKIASFSSTLGRNHPQMKALYEQETELEKRIAEFEEKNKTYLRSATSESRNPQLVEAFQNINTLRSSIAATESRRKTLTGQYADLTEKLNSIPAKEKEFALLQTEYEARMKDIGLLEARLTEANVKEQSAMQIPLTMIDQPMSPPIPKKTWIKVALAFGLSFALAVGLVLILGQFDAGAYNPLQAENALGFPVIASLPRTKQAELPKTEEIPSPLAASYQILSTNLLEMQNRLQGPAIVVASAEPNVGRSSVAANLAVSLARDGARVVLVDADLREPSLHRQFDVENRAGFVDVLSGSANIEDVAMPTPVEGLLIITAGKPPENPIRLLRGERLEWFLEQVAKAADYVIIDSPAGSAFADPDVIAGSVQNVLLVHEAGSPATQSEMEFHKRLERLGVNIIGVALNKVRPEDCHGYTSYRRAYEASILGRTDIVAEPSRPALRAPRRTERPASRPDASFDEEEDEE